MINSIYQLVGTRTLVVKFEDISLGEQVIVRPDYLAICHADQRYYLGQRDRAVLVEKLPMALIHEATGVVVHDPSGTYATGQRVVLIPNIAGDIRTGAYENYALGSGFRSSGYDGFLSEFVALSPDRVFAIDGVAPEVAAITEFVSVAAHACTRFDTLAHQTRDRLAIIGDGSMAYTVANVLKEHFPTSEIVILGRHQSKLALFTFVDETYYSSTPPPDLSFDHAFECVGSQGSVEALELLIKHINPQGSIVMLGVSEKPVPVSTRMVLEKGLTLVGCSRSGRADFEQAVTLLKKPRFQQHIRQIIYLDNPVHTVADIKRVFTNDRITPFKTVFEWRV
ncbi:MAG: zinc-binding dehydrogenase [Coriobacteriales bacterium]|nr:zinc-binding dehydrogenase [Coriobacteriales bacterium]